MIDLDLSDFVQRPGFRIDNQLVAHALRKLADAIENTPHGATRAGVAIEERDGETGVRHWVEGPPTRLRLVK